MAKRKGSRKASAKKKLRYAFIGAGGIAGAHMRYLKDMEDVEMVAMADISKPGMETKAEQFGIDGIFTDYRKMLSTVKPDAVSVCTPNGAHAEASISASNAGAHVMVEKPMAMSAAEAKKMITAANRKRRKLVIGFQHRYDPRTKFIKDAVDSGRMGKVIYGRIQALRRRGIPNWGVFGRKDLQGGGPLIDIGVHALEMTHFAMGSPTPVSAVAATQSRCVHATPSRRAGMRNLRSAPSPASDRGSTRSGTNCCIRLVSISPASLVRRARAITPSRSGITGSKSG